MFSKVVTVSFCEGTLLIIMQIFLSNPILYTDILVKLIGTVFYDIMYFYLIK